MRKLLLLLLLLMSSCAPKELADYVNPFIGTAAHGHTYPGATTPFGLVQLSPDTGTQGWDWCSGYHASDSSIMGFSHSHLSGTGGADLGDILLMPNVGKVEFEVEGYRSAFDKDNEKASAGYYSVLLDRPQIKVELTATPHVGVHRYKFQNTDNQHIIVDLNHGIQDVTTDTKLTQNGANRVEGFRRSAGWADDHTVFFVADFSEPIAKIEQDSTGRVSAIFFQKPTNEIVAKVAISYVDIDGARKNLEKEAAGKSFDDILAQTRATWNNELAKVKVEGNDRDKTIFYTNLYHTMLSPYGMSDVDGRYRSSDRQIYTDTTAVNYGLFSLWDTYRALHPLMTIVQPEKNQQFIQSLVRYYQQGGRLPVWDINMRENNCMIGYHAIPVIADAYIKGQRDFDTKTALEAMVHSAMQDNYAGLKYYRQYRYLPTDKENNAVSKALEYAYDDWCIAQMAKAMGQDSLYQVFNLRAQYYKNHFDPADGFMKGRNSQGKLRTPFSPTEISILGQGDFTEGNSWHYSFYVPQDVNTHIAMIGGDAKYVEKLEELFNSQSATADHSPDVSGLIGNYAQGNEPSHHVAYLYSFAGQPWRTQERINQIMTTLYTDQRDGLCGNEDCGQMSAWGVFSAMGFYPVTPASGIYVLGTPTFKNVKIGDFELIAEDLSKDNFYIEKAFWNGQPYTKSYITHEMVQNGGQLKLVMSSKPNQNFGFEVIDRPTAVITDGAMSSEQMLSDIIFEPYFQEQKRAFVDKIVVTSERVGRPATVRYTLDGSDPTAQSPMAPQSIIIDRDMTLALRSVATDDPTQASSVGRYRFYKGLLEKATVSGTQPSAPYVNGSLSALADGQMGGDGYKDLAWVGFAFDGKDVLLEITLPEPRNISQVAINLMSEVSAWIMLPSSGEISFSLRGGAPFGHQNLHLPDARTAHSGAHYLKTPTNVQADKIFITLKGQFLPSWHTSKGNPAWIFVDEITAY